MLANTSFGLCFEKGRGVPCSDPAEAARLYTLAASHGNRFFDDAMAVLLEKSLALDVPSAAALARIRRAVRLLNLASRG
jgi:TPR repeat protein